MSGLIVHEWLEPNGGAERVVDAMCEAFPDAALAVLWNDAGDKYQGVRESWLASTPLRKHKALATPLLPWTWRHLLPEPSDLDWLLVSSHLFAHQVDVRSPKGESVPKFVYAHTPARYIWEPSLDRRGQSPLVRVASAALKPIDRRRAKEPIAIAANSEFVRKRIQRCWQRDASVIFPPVDADAISSRNWADELVGAEAREIETLPRDFLLGASRFVPYKRLDWVIEAGSRLGVPVVIAGCGPQEDYLRRVAANASVPVYFVLGPSSAQLYALYQAARVFVFPAVEDFGIMPVEAQAGGSPVATTSLGGATESHLEGITGISAEEDSIIALTEAVGRALRIEHRDACVNYAQSFSKERFERELCTWLEVSARA